MATPRLGRQALGRADAEPARGCDGRRDRSSFEARRRVGGWARGLAGTWALAVVLPMSGQAAAATPAAPSPSAAPAAPACARPLYLSFDTGHMGVAEAIAEVLKREGVPATFFLANERTRNGGSSLDDAWAGWWRARAAEGHAFGSHTWDHGSWVQDVGGGRFVVRPSQGPQAGQRITLDAAGYCAELKRPATRFQSMTGQPMSAIFRAPGGKTSPALLAAAQACGFSHVGWAPAGFLGDELPSDRYPNELLLKQALERIRPGDILMAHLGIWSRRDPWAPAVLQPLIQGLKARGHCFATLRDHPVLGAAARRAVGG